MLIKSHDLRHFPDRIFRKTGDSCRQMGRCPEHWPSAGYSSSERILRSRFDIDSNRRIERQRPVIESPDRNQPAGARQSTRLHPAELPLGRLQDSTARSLDEIIGYGVYIRAYTIHRFDHLVRGMTRDVFGQCGSEHFATGSSLLPPEPFDPLEQIVRNRDSNPHAMSMTLAALLVGQLLEGPIRPTSPSQDPCSFLHSARQHHIITNGKSSAALTVASAQLGVESMWGALRVLNESLVNKGRPKSGCNSSWRIRGRPDCRRTDP